jgi:ATP-binding cassette subfamily B protein
MFALISKIMKYVWPQMRKRKWVLIIILIVFSVRVFLDQVLIAVFFKQIIDILSSGATDRSLVAGQILDVFFVLVGLHVMGFVIARTIKFVMFRFVINVIQDLRNFTFQKIIGYSQSFFVNTFSGSLVTKARRFVGGFETAFDVFLYRFFKFFVTLIGIFVILFYQTPKVALIFMVWVPIHIALTVLLIKRKIPLDLAEAEQDSKISGRLADVFSNISAVKFFSKAKNEIESFGEYTKEGAARSKVAWFMEGKVDLVQHSLIILADSLSLFIMIKLWLSGSISTGTIVLVHAYFIVIASSLWDLANSLSKFTKSISDMKEMVDIFEIIPDILDPVNPEELKVKEGNVVFENVDFVYKNGKEVFSDFNLNIKSGERVGLVGHSGAGKSTITSLILRLIDITAGSITIDGQDIRNITQDDLRNTISYVPQEPVLFHRTISENIKYSKPGATESEVVAATTEAHAHEFILALQKGYDTKVGERGVKLSGGERQRIAIARAMLKDAPILVLDEATSSLDSISESYIQDAFNELMKGKTTIVIAHRLSTIQKMDRIIVLDKGKIVEEGTHKQLLRKKGYYAELWNHQTGGFLQ